MQFRWLGLLIASALLFGACGDDDGSKATPDAGPADAGGGEAGKGEAGKAADMDAAVAPVTVKCDSEPMCTAPTLDLVGFLGPDNKSISDLAAGLTPDMLASYSLASEPCCTKTGSACGVSAGMITGGECIEQAQAGQPDDVYTDYELSLPEIMGIVLKPVTLAGCCRPDDKCGLRLDALGVGCVERTEATRLGMMGTALAPVDGGGIDAGPPLASINCVFAKDDGGTEDAGH